MTTRPSNEDIMRQLLKLQTEVIERDNQLEDKIDRTFVRISVFESELKAIDNRITPLQKFVYSVLGILGGAFITAIMGLFFTR